MHHMASNVPEGHTRVTLAVPDEVHQTVVEAADAGHRDPKRQYGLWLSAMAEAWKSLDEGKDGAPQVAEAALRDLPSS